jgi:hypothetical protein
MVEDGGGGGDQSCRVAVCLDDAGADPRTAGAPCVRLPANSVEPVYGLLPGLVVATVSDHDLDRGHLASRHRLRRSAGASERTRLPVRVPGQYLHPGLRRWSWDGPCGRAGSGA